MFTHHVSIPDDLVIYQPLVPLIMPVALGHIHLETLDFALMLMAPLCFCISNYSLDRIGLSSLLYLCLFRDIP